MMCFSSHSDVLGWVIKGLLRVDTCYIVSEMTSPAPPNTLQAAPRRLPNTVGHVPQDFPAVSRICNYRQFWRARSICKGSRAQGFRCGTFEAMVSHEGDRIHNDLIPVILLSTVLKV